MKEEQRKYNLTTTIAMIIGIVIGSGIFFKADDILLLTGGSVAVGCIVLILGAFSIIFGGMTIAEWAKITDDAGGLISYGEKAFGKKFAFFIGWFQMSVYFPTLASVVCWVGANYTIQLFSNVTWLKHFTWQLTLFYMILFFVINTCAPKIAGYLQTSATIIKIIPLIIIAIVVLLCLGTFFLMKPSKKKGTGKVRNIIGKLVSILLSVALLFGTLSIAQGTSVLDAITGANVQTQRYSVVVLKDSSYKTLSDLKGETIETVSSVDEENAKKAIEKLKKNNVKKIVMLTGDKKAVGESVAKELGLDEVYTELLPNDKVEKVEELMKSKSEKGKLAFVGDGINDAPVLAISDIGIAMGGLGSDAAIEAADVVLMTDEPSKVVDAIKISKKTLKIVKQNIIFAIAVKILVLILSAIGLSNMWQAVFADVGVSVLAILNALRVLVGN